MRRRGLTAVAVSLGLHGLALATVLGSSLWQAWRLPPVEVDITGMTLDELKDLPLGGPTAGAGNTPAAPAAAPALPAAPPVPEAPRPRPRKANAAADAAPDEPQPPPRPTSVRSYGPAGSRVTALVRVDRLRGTAYAPAVDGLLMRLPDRRELLDGTDLDLYRDIDALLIATPNPMDPAVTLLVARHRLSDAELRAALERGARATGRRLAWRTERGRPFAERRAAAGDAEDPAGGRDHRLILMAAPHLVVVTPPAYRALILAGRPRATAARSAGGGGAGGAAPANGAGGAGGAPALDDPSSRDSWAALIRRIDAEDSIMPANAVAMLSVVDLFSARRSRAIAPTRGADDDAPALVPPTILGLPAPRALTVTLGIAPAPFADVDAELASAEDAAAWERAWPALRHDLLSNRLVALTGFSAHSELTLTRDGDRVRLHVVTTEDITVRVLGFLALGLPGIGR